MRTCRSCLIDKNESEYSINKHIKDGLSTLCKECGNSKAKARYALRSSEGAMRVALYRENNPDKAKESLKRYKEKMRLESAAVKRLERKLRKESMSEDDIIKERNGFVNRYRTDAEFKAKIDSESRENSRDVRAVLKKEKRKAWELAKDSELKEYRNGWTVKKRATDPEWHANELEIKTVWRLKNWHKEEFGGPGWIRDIASRPVDQKYVYRLHAWQQNRCYFCNTPFADDCTVEHILPRSKGGPNLEQNIVLTCEDCNYGRQAKIYHLEWQPKRYEASENLFLKPKTVGAALAEVGIEFTKDTDNNCWVLKASNGASKTMFILSTFMCSTRNLDTSGAKVAAHIQKTFENAIIFFDYEWYGRRESCLNLLKSKLGISFRGPGARKLDLVTISQKEADTFLDSHHVMGKRSGIAYRMALTDGNMIHGVGLFTDKGEVWECDRLAFHGHIPGGMSKLMKGLWDLEGYKPIKTFVDSRYASGAGHETVGFRQVGMSPDSYQWVFPDKVKHQRYLSNENKMSQNLLYFNPNASNGDNIIANGVHKIWTPKRHTIIWEK